MKKQLSIKWKASKQPRKQRKYRANAALHSRHKLVSANLNKELRKKYEKRNVPIRKGDSVKIRVGEFKGKTGKISLVNLKKLRVVIEGINRIKKDGTKVNVYFDPSNLQIQELFLEDKKRIASLKKTNLKENITEEKNASKKK